MPQSGADAEKRLASPTYRDTAHTFISYSRLESAYVQRLVTFLTDAGLPLWYDHDIPSGERFDRLLDERIRQCGAFVVVMTPAAYASEWVINEVSHAQRLRKPILPMLLEGSPFLSLSSRDYEDVVGGRMPTPRFMRTLRDHLAQRLGT